MNKKTENKPTPLHAPQHRSHTKKSSSGSKEAASSTPKTKLTPSSGTEPDIVFRRKNRQANNQNVTYNINVTSRKATRPISYQHISNKALVNEKSTNSTPRLKQAKSIPSLLEDSNKELRPISTKIRGKTGKEHHTTGHESSAVSAGNPSGGTAPVIAAPTSLPRTASASANLNVLAPATKGGTTTTAGGKSARGKGGGSRERLVDGGGDNSTKRALRDDRPASGESVLELEQMQRQINEMAAEKSVLMLQLEDRVDQLNELQNEMKVLKIYQEQSADQLEQKTDENSYLRSKLRDVVHSPLSDSEKQQLLLIDSHRHHSSAPASIAVNVPNETGDVTACPTPDWDKHSSSNVSDVSVACLQDKIYQMQETHYSTNEELQATLQELTDLQRQLTELQMHNNRLGDEKNLMFDSLCRQTDRLKESRSELDSLKQLFNTTQDKSDTAATQQYAEREAQLLDIVQRLEVERDNLRDRQQELLQDLQQMRISNDQDEEERSRLIERVRMLEGSFDAKVAENRQTEQELSQTRDEYSGSKIEIDRLNDILENARTKIVELEQDRDLGDKSELDELLDAARKEKDTLELEITLLREQVAKSRNEIEKLREQVSILQEECKVTRNNAKCTQSELDYKVETLICDKTNLIEQLQRLQEAVGSFELQNQCLNEDKRQLNGVLSDTQRNLSETEEKLHDVVHELGELKKIREADNKEWEKFRDDLLTSVRVANDFKTEAQQDLQTANVENKGYRERVKQLEIQIDKLKGGASEFPLSRSSIRRSIHVTPRKVEEGSALTQKTAKLQMKECSDSETNIKLGFAEQKTTENKFKSSSVPKEAKKNKSVIPESKKVNNIQDVDDTPNAILSVSLQELNSTKKSKAIKQSKGHERSSSNLESESPSKIQDGVDLPRKKSADNRDSGIYTGVIQPTAKKPIKIKQPKARTKTTKSLLKLLTEADEQKLLILGDMLAHIDPSVPIDLLTEEDKSLLRLKSFYDSREMYRLKPIAKKPKHELCISNPLMNSVFANPALKKIAEDPNLPAVEPILSKLQLKESFYFQRKQSKHFRHNIESATMFEDGLPERHLNRRTYSTFQPSLGKSQSVSNLVDKAYVFDSDEEMSIKRFLTEEDLSKTFVIAPSDSKLSLNLWTGTYTFSKQPKHRSDSDCSYDSDLHVYAVNEDVNRSTSFIYEGPQESLDRKVDTFESTKSLGSLDLPSHNKKASKSKKGGSETNLDSAGRLRKFVGGLFGSKENLEVIHETRNTTFGPSLEVVNQVQAFERPTSSIVYCEIPKQGQKSEFERRKSLEEIGTHLEDVIYQNLDDVSSGRSSSEVQEKSLYLDFEDELDCSVPNQFTKASKQYIESSDNESDSKNGNLTFYNYQRNISECNDSHVILEPVDLLTNSESLIIQSTTSNREIEIKNERLKDLPKEYHSSNLSLSNSTEDKTDSSVSNQSTRDSNKDINETESKEEEILPKESKDIKNTLNVEATDANKKIHTPTQNSTLSQNKNDQPVASESDKVSHKDFATSDRENEFDVDSTVFRKPTDSLRKHHDLATSLSLANFTEDEIQLVQRVVESNLDSQSRPQSDLNNDDIIIIEWIDYCNQCMEVGTIALNLEEYSREIKSGRNVSELENVTRRSTELNEQQSLLRQQDVLDPKRKKAEATANFLDQKNMELLQNFAKDSSRKRASAKLDILERTYSLKDDLDQLPKDFALRKSDCGQSISRSAPEIDPPKKASSQIDDANRTSKEFHYVEDILDSWKSKTRRKMRYSIQNAGFELYGPTTEPIYQNVEPVVKDTDPWTATNEAPVPNKAPKATPRSTDRLPTDAVSLPKSIQMADDKARKDDNEKDNDSDNLRAAPTVYALPTLEAPDPPKKDDKDADKDVKKTNNNNLPKNPVEYPTLERVAVSHVLNNNLPMFGKLNEYIKDEQLHQQHRENTVQDDDDGTSSASTTKKESLEQRTQFQIRSIRKEPLNEAGSRDNFLRARDKFRQAEDEDKLSSRDSSPRGSFRKKN